MVHFYKIFAYIIHIRLVKRTFGNFKEENTLQMDFSQGRHHGKFDVNETKAVRAKSAVCLMGCTVLGDITFSQTNP